jgi:hypothetical protein
MTEVSVSQATLIASIIIANAAAILGAYVSMRVQIAVLKEKVDYLTDWMKTHNQKSKDN